MSRWTPREGRSWTRRSWIGTGWTGCTPFPALWSYSASSTSTRPSAALSWWWWPCWCFTCEQTSPWSSDHLFHLIADTLNLSDILIYCSPPRWIADALWCVCRHQAGWFPFNLENELRLPGDQANPDDMEEEPQNPDLQEMVATPPLREELSGYEHMNLWHTLI